MSTLEFGIWITVVGMGIVFGVLALLYGLLVLGTRADRRWSSRSARKRAGVASPGTPARASVVVRTQDDDGQASGAPHDPELVAAITIAILDHVDARRLQAAPAMRSYWPGSLLFASRWVSAGRTRQGTSWRRGRR